MKGGIAQKLTITYIIIIISTIISGIYCFYVLRVNQRATSEMRYVTLPSLENLKEMRSQMQEIKKLSSTWVFMTNNKDKERLLHIINEDYPLVSKNLDKNSNLWKNDQELQLYNQIKTNNNQIIDSVIKITVLLNSPESYANDSIVDKAAYIYNAIEKTIRDDDKSYENLIKTKNDNLKSQQISIHRQLIYLYLIIFITILIVITVSFFSMRFSRKNVVKPLLELNRIISAMGHGEVIAINEVEPHDEIGQMNNAISKMVSGVMQKINFSEQIGKGNYDTDFTLLSDKDKLGIALLTMRNDLKRTNETLTEQEKRLIDAQRIARVGNYFVDMNTGKFQSSTTLDEILGIDDTFEKTRENWKNLIAPEYQTYILDKISKAIQEKTRYAESYIIHRHNDGQERWVSSIGEYKYDEHGNVVMMYGTLQDITESKMLEIELSNSYNIATEQNRRLLNFSYIVSHNLRMYAVNISSLLNLIEDAESEEEKKEMFQYLHTASERLDETLHHLNEIVAMQNTLDVDIEQLNLNEYINHAVDLLKTQIINKDALIVNNVSDDLVINYNKAYLDSIILNFLSNAIKYSHPDRQPIINIDCYKENNNFGKNYWILKIADNGIGIDLNKHGNKLFGMYKTFHDNKDAKGIGLFMTKYQVEAMGGKVEVASELNKGTTFKIYIR